MDTFTPKYDQFEEDGYLVTRITYGGSVAEFRSKIGDSDEPSNEKIRKGLDIALRGAFAPMTITQDNLFAGLDALRETTELFTEAFVKQQKAMDDLLNQDIDGVSDDSSD